MLQLVVGDPHDIKISANQTVFLVNTLQEKDKELTVNPKKKQEMWYIPKLYLDFFTIIKAWFPMVTELCKTKRYWWTNNRCSYCSIFPFVT